MFSSDEVGDRAAIVQMNAELHHAQLEMLSAQCATDRLRLRYSAEDIARHDIKKERSPQDQRVKWRYFVNQALNALLC